MALSRLRHPAICRAPSLLKSHLFSSASLLRSSSRICNSSSPVNSDDVHLRPGTNSTFSGVNYSSSKLKVTCIRRISSSGTPPHEVIGMPALSPTMSQGNLAKWRKKEGEKINVGDVICEIETDKATIEFESLEEGYMAKILVPEGSKDVPVGRPIFITVEELDDIQNVPGTVTGGSEVKEEKPTSYNEVQGQETGAVKISTSELPPHIVHQMPALSPTMSQGNIGKWMKKEGDKIDVGDVLCEIETDKATLEFECLEEGFLAKILAPEGSKDVAVGQAIAITVEEQSDIDIVKNSVSRGVEVNEKKANYKEVVSEPRAQTTSFHRISPSAKLLITEHGLDASSIMASGPRGTLLKGDVLAAIKSGNGSSRRVLTEKMPQSSQPHPQISQLHKSETETRGQPDLYEDLPNSQIRKVIAKRLLESKLNIPHLYLSSDVILDPLLSFRKELKDKHDVKVSVNDIIIKAVANALRNVPDANAYWDADKGEIVLLDSVDISIAVATDKGLMTPIVRNADQKTISSISLEVKELAARARAGKLSPNEFQGGTFSISNLGMFPVDRFCAIINPPQACILAVGRGNQVVEAVIGDDGTERPAAVTKMNLTLSADHRVFDGKVGGDFLSVLRSNFSNIRRLLL